ncbi:MAG TPA: hypothetical protein VFV01_16915 [Spirillospora sp.]|nr:hypothetical protein [Spirillospora sp.]
MATTDPWSGVTVYQQTDQALGGLEIGNVASQLSPLVIPRFPTTAARDAAANNWVSLGNALVDGMECAVGAVKYRRVSGAWRQVFTDYLEDRVSANAGLVNPDAAITGVITVPAAPVACRVTFTATGRVGNAAGSRTIAWDWDSKPASASNMAQDDPANRITVAANQLAAISTTLIMDVPANVSATARLMYRASDNGFNYGAVVWHRGPAS